MGTNARFNLMLERLIRRILEPLYLFKDTLKKPRYFALKRARWIRLLCSIVLVASILYLISSPVANAAIPHYLTFQGKLTDIDGNPVADGSYSVTFRLYSAQTGGDALWTEPQSVTVSGGVFTVALGTTTDFDLLFDTQYWLSVQVGSDTEMSPRQRLTAAGYAINADKVDQLSGDQFLRSDDNDTTTGQITFTNIGTAITIQPLSAPSADTRLIDVKDAAGTRTFSVDYEGDIEFDGTISGDGSGLTGVGSSSIDDDSLDWDKFTDSMTLDTTTTINMDTNSADLNFDSGTLYIDDTGKVGIGTTEPSYPVDISVTTSAIERAVNVAISGSTSGTNYAGYFDNTNSGGTEYGVYAKGTTYGLSALGGQWGLYSRALWNNGRAIEGEFAGEYISSGDICAGYFSNIGTGTTASLNKYGVYITSTGSWSGTGANNYGLYANVTGGTNNYAAVFEGGNVGIGTTEPSAGLTIGTGSASYATTSDDLYLTGTLEVGGSTYLSDIITSNLTVTGDLLPTADDTYNLGTLTGPYRWQDAFFSSTVTAGGFDDGTLSITGGNLTTTGNLTIDTDLFAVDSSANTVTVGADGTGYDVKFYGTTSSVYFLWDSDEDKLVVEGPLASGTPALQVGSDGTGADVKFFGTTSDSFLLWDSSEDDLILSGNTSAPDLILDNSTTGSDADSGYITLRGNDSDGDTELDMSVFLDVTATDDYKLSFKNDDRTTEVASLDESGNLQIDGTFTVGAVATFSDDVVVGVDTNFANTSASPDLYVQGNLEVDGSVWLGDGTADTLTVTGTLSAGSLKYTGDLLPADDDAYNIGTLTGPYEWQNLYIDGKAYIDGLGESITLDDAVNITLNTSTGTKIGTGTTQKLGFFDAAPVVQAISTTDLKDTLTDLGLLATGGATPLNLDGGAFTTTGNLTIDTDLFVVDSSGDTVTVGVNSTGYDVKFFGTTAGSYLLWDASEDEVVVAGTVSVGESALQVGADGTGYDVRFYGTTAGHYLLWDGANNDLLLVGTTGGSDASFTFDAVNNQITHSSATIDFDNENLTTTGSISDGVATLSDGSLTDVKLGSLGTDGFVKTGSSDGTLSVDQTTYIDPTYTGDVTITGTVQATTLYDGTLTINSGNLTTAGSGRFDAGLGVGVAPNSDIGLKYLYSGANSVKAVDVSLALSGDSGYGRYTAGTVDVNEKSIWGAYNEFTVNNQNDTAYGTHNVLSTKSGIGDQWLYGTRSELTGYGTQHRMYGNYVYLVTPEINDPDTPQIGYFVRMLMSGTDANLEKWAFYNISDYADSGKMFMGKDGLRTYWGTGYVDSYIEFDGDSMNIVANNLTPSDDLEIAADSVTFTGTTVALGTANLTTAGTITQGNIGIGETATPTDTKINILQSGNNIRFEGYDTNDGGQTIGLELDFDDRTGNGPELTGTTTKDAVNRIYIDANLIFPDDRKFVFATSSRFDMVWDSTNNDYMAFRTNVGNAAYSGNFVFMDRANTPSEDYPIVSNPTFRIQSSSAVFADYIQFYHDGTDGRIESGSDTINFGNDNLTTTGTITADKQVDSSLIAEYKFDADAGDYSGNGYDGTFQGGAASTDGVAAMPALADYVDLDTHASNFAGFTAGTISFWYNITKITEEQFFLAFSDDSETNSYFLIGMELADQKIHVDIIEGGVAVLEWKSTAATYDALGWVHVVYSSDSTGNSIEINGVADAGTYDTGNASTQAFIADVNDVDRFLLGYNEMAATGAYIQMDDLAIYDRRLAANERKQLHERSSKNAYVDEIRVASGLGVNASPNSSYWAYIYESATGNTKEGVFVDLTSSGGTATGIHAKIRPSGGGTAGHFEVSENSVTLYGVKVGMGAESFGSTIYGVYSDMADSGGGTVWNFFSGDSGNNYFGGDNVKAKWGATNTDLEVYSDGAYGRIDATTGVVIGNKLAFTQTDGNEYIDSLTSTDLDLEATTAINLRINATEEFELTATQLDLKTNNLVTTGAVDFGAVAASLEIPNDANPTTDADGEIAWDSDDNAIEVYDGSASRLISSLEDIDALIFAPDGVADEIAIFHVDADKYPHGIKIVNVQITLDSDAEYAMVFEEWAGDPPVAQNDIFTVTTTAGDAYKEETTFASGDPDLDADDYVFLHVPATDVDWVQAKVLFYAKEGD